MGWLLTINKNIKTMSNGYGKDYINPDILSGKTNYKKDTEKINITKIRKKVVKAASADDMLLGDANVVSDTTFKNPEKIGYNYGPLASMAGDNPIAASMMTGLAAGQAIRQNVIVPRQQAKQQYELYTQSVGAVNAISGTNTQAIGFKPWNKTRRQAIKAGRKAARIAKRK